MVRWFGVLIDHLSRLVSSLDCGCEFADDVNFDALSKFWVQVLRIWRLVDLGCWKVFILGL